MKWLPAERPTPALLVRPADAASLDEAHLAIELWEWYSRKTLDESQRVAVELMMAEKVGGKWAAGITGRAMPRQNGKGDEIEVVEFYGMTQRGEAILHTAHEIPTAKSAHLRMCSLLGHRDFRGKFHPTFGNGNFEIEWMPDGKRSRENPAGIIQYRTRTGPGGRGLDDISRIVVDEAQHAQPEQLASSMPTLMINPNPQRNFIGTAGVEGKSDWWWTIRRLGLSGDGDGFAYLEHSAEQVELTPDGRVMSTKPDPADEAIWPEANPAFGRVDLTDEFRKELKVLGPDLFAREHLCVWDPESTGDAFRQIDVGRWDSLAHRDSAPVGKVVLAVDVSPGWRWTTFGLAGRRADGVGHVETRDRRPGTDWLVARAKELCAGHGCSLLVDPKSPAGAFIRELTEAKVPVEEVSGTEYAQSCGALAAAVAEGKVRHRGSDELRSAVVNATDRPLADAWAWSRVKSEADITPLVAVSLAWGRVPQPVKGGLFFAVT